MAWTKEFVDYRRWTQFEFFSTGSSGFSGESIMPGTDFAAMPWKLAEIRIHFSVEFASVMYLTARLSATKGSAYNTVLISSLMSVLGTNYLLQYSDPLLFLSDDHLVFATTSTAWSSANIMGIQVIGWAALG